MKKLIIFLSIALFTVNIQAQSPEKISYQAVIRDNSNNLLTNTVIGLQISILKNSASGTEVYVETQNPTTNANGLMSIEIGEGKVVKGDFSIIDWANGTYFIKSEIDPEGSTNYTITGTNQLLSVPYALHAKTAESLSGTIENENEFYLGKDTLGGVVFHIYTGSDGQKHGLIVSKNETVAYWQSVASIVGANSNLDGKANMNLMTDSPAKDWITSNYDDNWYLPARHELILLVHSTYTVNRAMKNMIGGQVLSTGHYWSSTESFLDTAEMISVFGIISEDKTAEHPVRVIRAF